MFAWQATVQDEFGNAVLLPVVTVYESDGVTLADIFEEDGVTPLNNPLTGTMEGFVQFWAVSGEYRIIGADGPAETDEWSVFLGVPEQVEISTRAGMATAIAGGFIPVDGVTYWLDGLGYLGVTGATAIADLPGLAAVLPYRAAHHGSTDNTLTLTLAASGAMFSTPQDAIDYAAGFDPRDTITISQTGTVTGSVILRKDCGHVLWQADTSRSSLEYSDFTSAYAPDWASADNDTDDPTTNTLFIALKSAIGAMLRTKYSAIVEITTGNGFSLGSHSFNRIQDILFINTGAGQRGFSTGESIKAGTGGTVELRNCSVHGFKASGLSTNYSGTFILHSAAVGSSCTSSCNGDSGLISQYAGCIYAQEGIYYGNWQFGARIKQQGLIYTGRGHVCYNRFDGLNGYVGGAFNALGGVLDYNGGYGVNVFGGANAECSEASLSNNIGGGVRAQDGGFAYARAAIVNDNGGIGLYATGGRINASDAVVTGNGSHAANAAQGGYVNATGATLANSAEGQGCRVDNEGYIDATDSIIYGNVNALTRQVLVNMSGTVSIAGAVDDLSAAILTGVCTPPIGARTSQGAYVTNESVNTTIRLHDETYAAMEVANGPQMLNINSSATVPSLLPNRSVPTRGIGSGLGGELALIHTSATRFGVNETYVRAGTEYRVGDYPGTKVVGSRVTGFTAMTGTATKTAINTGTATLEQLAQRVKALDDALRAHGIIGT